MYRCRYCPNHLWIRCIWGLVVLVILLLFFRKTIFWEPLWQGEILLRWKMRSLYFGYDVEATHWKDLKRKPSWLKGKHAAFPLSQCVDGCYVCLWFSICKFQRLLRSIKYSARFYCRVDEIKWSLTLIPMAAIARERRGSRTFQVMPLQAQLRSILAIAGESR